MGDNSNSVLADYLSGLYRDAHLSGAILRNPVVLCVEGLDYYTQKTTFLRRVQVNGQWDVQTTVSRRNNVPLIGRESQLCSGNSTLEGAFSRKCYENGGQT